MKNTKCKTSEISLRISVTDRCQLNCIYCDPPGNSKKSYHQNLLGSDEIAVFVDFLNKNFGISKVHLTGGEPLLRPEIVTIIEKISAKGVEDIALTTNGQMLGDMAADLKRAGLRRVNISLDSLDEDNFNQLTHAGKLSRTLAGIENAIESGLHPIKLNTVVIKNKNDHEVMDIAEYGIAHNCHVRFLELMPFGLSAIKFNDWFVSSNEIMAQLEEKYQFTQLIGKSGSSSRNFSVRDSSGRTGIIGFISPLSAPFCSDCRRLRLTSDGRLLGCLAQKVGFDIRTLLQNENSPATETMSKVIETALRVKLNSSRYNTDEVMAKIGG